MFEWGNQVKLSKSFECIKTSTDWRFREGLKQ